MDSRHNEDSGTRPGENELDDEIDAAFAGYVDRLIAGEMLDTDEIVRDHPTIANELLSRLTVYQNVAGDRDSREALGTLGDYTLRRQIGRGGMGVVYEAWQNSMDRSVALKVLPVGIAADDKAYMRFMREAKAAGKLNHQNIVHVYGMGVEENTPYFSMLTGQSPRTFPRS